MNILGFVFSLLMILSFGFALCAEKQVSAQRLRSSYLGHWHANRQILVACETEFYNSLNYKKEPVIKKNISTKKPKEHKNPPPLKPNPKCACLNLFPLIEKTREEEPLLYETAARLFKLFYGESLFEKKPHKEFHFLNAFLEALRTAKRNKKSLALEKIRFKKEEDQLLYYKMLKGTKDATNGYPSLLDYMKIESTTSKICLFHAHPFMLSVLFGPKAATKIYQTIHVAKPPNITIELIERLCSEAHTLIYNTEIFNLMELGRPKHKKEFKQTLIGEDTQTHISLKKTVILNG